MTTANGNDVTEVTASGDTVSEITVNGDVVWRVSEPDVTQDMEGLSSVGDFYYTRTGNWAVHNTFAHNGSQSIYGEIPSGGHEGGPAAYRYPDHGWGQPDEKYERAYIYLDSNWSMADSDSCKLWWVGWNAEAGDAGTGGDGPPTGNDGWSSRVFIKHYADNAADEFELEQYEYHMDQGGSYGDENAWGMSINSGQWYQLDTYVKMNTVSGGTANADGVVRCWLDGTLGYEQTGMRWRTTTDMGIEYSGGGIYYGGTETAPNALYFHVDDHMITIDGGESL